MTRANGFTLIEALVALGVSVVLIGLAGSAWAYAHSAVTSGLAREALVESFMLSSRHALASGSDVVLCSSTDGSQCSGSTDWSKGWLAFADISANRRRDPFDTLLHIQPPLAGDVGLNSTQGRTRLIFHDNGGNGGSNVTFTLCEPRSRGKATTLVMSNEGRMRQGLATDEVAETCRRGG